MAASQIAGGTLAAAVLGIGTAKASPDAASSSVDTAGEITRQLAATGTNGTVELVMLAVLLLMAGFLLYSLQRRHTGRT